MLKTPTQRLNEVLLQCCIYAEECNRLRTLEQQVNAAEMPDDAKVRLQSYITGCYGTLTSFNVLFADEEDQFKGSGGE